MKFLKYTFLSFLLLMVSTTMNVQAQNNTLGSENKPQHMTVSGTSDIKVKPDRVIITVGFSERSADLKAAKNTMNETIKSVIAYAKKKGVNEKDIQTAYIDIRPEEPKYNEKSMGKNEKTYYMINQSLSIVLENVDAYDTFIFELLDLGVNVVSDIQFTNSEEEKYKNQARTQAVEKAKENALLLTKAAGVKLVRVINVSEENVYQPVYKNAGMMGAAYDSSGGGASAAGSISIKATVNLTYELE